MGKTLTVYRENIGTDLGDAAHSIWSTTEIDRACERAVSDLSRFLPREKVYEVTLSKTVTKEAVTLAAAHGTYKALTYKNIKVGTEKVYIKRGDLDGDGDVDSDDLAYLATYVATPTAVPSGAGITTLAEFRLRADADANGTISGTVDDAYMDTLIAATGTQLYYQVKRDVDYTIDYSNGQITSISGGLMSISKVYYVDYEKLTLAVDISSLTDMIRVNEVEWVGQIPRALCSTHVSGNTLFIDGVDGESQDEMGVGDHIAIRYDAVHANLDSAVSSTHPGFLDNTICTLAAAYCLFEASVKRTGQSATDIASARTAMAITATLAATLQASITTALAAVASNSAAGAARIAAIVTDAANLRTAANTALDALNAYVDIVGATGTGDLHVAADVNSDVDTYMSTNSEVSILYYLKLGSPKILTLNLSGEGQEVAQSYLQYAQGANLIVAALNSRRTDYINQANARVSAALAYAQEAATRLSNLRSYIEEANAYTGVANVYARQAEAALVQVQTFISTAQRYVENASGELVIADRYRQEAIERRDEVYKIWADRKQYIGDFSTSSTRQSPR
jgi:hypothetical protein